MQEVHVVSYKDARRVTKQTDDALRVQVSSNMAVNCRERVVQQINVFLLQLSSNTAVKFMPVLTDILNSTVTLEFQLLQN